MPEYRRFIAYFYEYIDGKKQKNTGFAKVELRNGTWRLLFRLTAPVHPRPPVEVYGFVREGEYLLGLLMGTMRAGREMMEEWAYHADDMRWKGKYGLSDFSGIWIRSGDGRNFITVWDEEPVRTDRFVTELPDEMAERTAADAVSQTEKGEASQETQSLEEEEKKENKENKENKEKKASDEAEWELEAAEVSGSVPQKTGQKEELDAKGCAPGDTGEPGSAANGPERGEWLAGMQREQGSAGELSSASSEPEREEQSAGMQREQGSVSELSSASSEPEREEQSAGMRCEQGSAGEPDNIGKPGSAVHDVRSGKMKLEKPQKLQKNTAPRITTPEDAVKRNAEQAYILEVTEAAEGALTETESEDQKLWEKLYQSRTQFCPFADQEIRDCIRIVPGDVFQLQRARWRTGRNSFLMHGYYHYHHLMLGRTEEGRFVLGVPGIMNSQEKYLAVMFGFPNFKFSDALDPAGGYWYRILEQEAQPE